MSHDNWIYCSILFNSSSIYLRGREIFHIFRINDGTTLKFINFEFVLKTTNFPVAYWLCGWKGRSRTDDGPSERDGVSISETREEAVYPETVLRRTKIKPIPRFDFTRRRSLDERLLQRQSSQTEEAAESCTFIEGSLIDFVSCVRAIALPQGSIGHTSLYDLLCWLRQHATLLRVDYRTRRILMRMLLNKERPIHSEVFCIYVCIPERVILVVLARHSLWTHRQTKYNYWCD